MPHAYLFFPMPPYLIGFAKTHLKDMTLILLPQVTVQKDKPVILHHISYRDLQESLLGNKKEWEGWETGGPC